MKICIFLINIICSPFVGAHNPNLGRGLGPATSISGSGKIVSRAVPARSVGKVSDYSAANVLKSGDFLAAFSRHSDSGEQREWRTDRVKSGKEEYEERRESSPPSLSLLPPLPDFFPSHFILRLPKAVERL